MLALLSRRVLTRQFNLSTNIERKLSDNFYLNEFINYSTQLFSTFSFNFCWPTKITSRKHALVYWHSTKKWSTTPTLHLDLSNKVDSSARTCVVHVFALARTPAFVVTGSGELDALEVATLTTFCGVECCWVCCIIWWIRSSCCFVSPSLLPLYYKRYNQGKYYC